MTEIRKLCAHCYWHMKTSYENFELSEVVSAEKGPAAFGKGTNYYLKLSIETKGPGAYKGQHDIFVFTGEKDEYKSMAIDEFPQMEKPFLGDRITMEKQWAAVVRRDVWLDRGLKSCCPSAGQTNLVAGATGPG